MQCGSVSECTRFLGKYNRGVQPVLQRGGEKVTGTFFRQRPLGVPAEKVPIAFSLLNPPGRGYFLANPCRGRDGAIGYKGLSAFGTMIEVVSG